MATEEKRLKINLELHIVGDGRRFINFWNYKNGDDVIAEVANGSLYVDGRKTTLNEFINKVKLRFE